MTVRLDRVQQGLFEALSSVAPDVVWSYSQTPREQISSDLLTLNMTSGPSAGFRQARQNVTMKPATSVVVRVTGATVGTRNVIRLNGTPMNVGGVTYVKGGFDYATDTVALDTVTTIRDRLFALMSPAAPAPAPEPALAISTDGADGILLDSSGSFLGALRGLELFGELGNDPPTFPGAAPDAIKVTEATREGIITVQAFSKNRSPRSGAWNLAQLAMDELQSDDGVNTLIRYGVGIRGLGPVVPLPVVIGGNYESRAAFDVFFAARSVFVRTTETIETVNYSVDVTDVAGPIGTVSGSVVAP